MQRETSFVDLLRRMRIIIPSFAIVSLIACLATYASGVPRKDLAVTAAVPLVAIFAVAKLLGLIVPAPSHAELAAAPRAPASVWRIGQVGIIATLLIAVSLLSAGLFAYLGLNNHVAMSLRFAEGSAICAVLCFLLIVFIAMRTVIKDWSEVLLREIANLLTYPMRLVDSLHLHKSRCP